MARGAGGSRARGGVARGIGVRSTKGGRGLGGDYRIRGNRSQLLSRGATTATAAVTPATGNAGGGKKSSDNSKNKGSRTTASVATAPPAVRPSAARASRGQLIRQIAARSGGTGRTPINLARNARRSQRAA